MDKWKIIGYISLGVFIAIFAVLSILTLDSNTSFNALFLSIFASLLASGVVSLSFDISSVLKRKKQRKIYCDQIIVNLISVGCEIVLFANNTIDNRIKKTKLEDSIFCAINNCFAMTNDAFIKHFLKSIYNRLLQINAHIKEISEYRFYLNLCDYLTKNETESLFYAHDLINEIISLIDFGIDYQEAFTKIETMYKSILNDTKPFKKFFDNPVGFYLTKQNEIKPIITVPYIWL